MSLQDAIEQELEDKIKQLQAELATARNQLIENEQTEAAVCPEDVGIKEYVQSLLDKLDEHRWTPVEERLPEACNSETEYSPKVLVAHCRNEFVSTDYYLTKKQCWKGSPPWRYTHWKPIILPEGE